MSLNVWILPERISVIPAPVFSAFLTIGDWKEQRRSQAGERVIATVSALWMVLVIVERGIFSSWLTTYHKPQTYFVREWIRKCSVV